LDSEIEAYLLARPEEQRRLTIPERMTLPLDLQIQVPAAHSFPSLEHLQVVAEPTAEYLL
jgi:hypothetical protein